MSGAVSQRRLGAFRLLDEGGPIGAGGQGAVRRAVCERADFPGLSVGATVALKIVPESDADDSRWRQLESMVATLIAVNAPNIVRYYGCFSEQSGVCDFFVAVMELLDGETLRARMARDPKGLGVDAALETIRAAAAGLGAAAAAGIVHRDVKPDNIFLCSDGRVKVIDFGIARREDARATTGLVPGTPDYMSPEVTTGASRGSAASDLYALGCCLYEALTGRTVFPRFKGGSSGSLEAFVVRARQKRAPKLDAPLVRANPDLERLLRRMTEPDAGRRMSNAAEAELELLDLQDSFRRGEWRIPPDEPGADDSDGDEAPTVDDVLPATPAEKPPIPALRRIIRNRRELFLILALIIELLSNAVIVWQRPRARAAVGPATVEGERGH